MCPCRAFYERRLMFFVTFAGNVVSLKTQISQKMQKCKYLAEKKQNKKNICKRLDRGIVNTCAQFQGLSLKNGVGIGHGIWGFMLEPALRTLGNTPSNVVLTLYVTIPVMDL